MSEVGGRRTGTLLTENSVVHQLEEVLLECRCSQSALVGIEVDVFLQPRRLLERQHPVYLRNLQTLFLIVFQIAAVYYVVRFVQ